IAPSSLKIRLDANGAYTPKQALQHLNKLYPLNIHSVEQPIPAGNIQDMHKISKESPIPIALDEELIKVKGVEDQKDLLSYVNPSYLVLKPSILGGFSATQQWISLAQAQNIGWWLTSSLESNLGLSALAQFASTYPLSTTQGLGTGNLYLNNLRSSIHISAAHLCPGSPSVPVHQTCEIIEKEGIFVC
ncbi:MAG: hypothetical protein OXB93_03915, partial [Cytophagales bacterium]|nr:hypothetical protein [Cytophagales bacterium]